MNSVQLVGRLTKDPDYRQNGESTVCRFTVAVNRRFKNQQGQYDADFLNCVAFKTTADFISKYFKKGQMIGVTGRIQTGSYTNKEGQKVYTTDIIVDAAEFTESKSQTQENTQGQGNAQQAQSGGFDNGGFANVPDLNEPLPFN